MKENNVETTNQLPECMIYEYSKLNQCTLQKLLVFGLGKYITLQVCCRWPTSWRNYIDHSG